MPDLILNGDEIRICVNEFLRELEQSIAPNSWEDHFAFTAYNLAREGVTLEEFDQRMVSSWEGAYALNLTRMEEEIGKQRDTVGQLERKLLDTMKGFSPFEDQDIGAGFYRPAFPYPQESILLRELLREADRLTGFYGAFASAALDRRPPRNSLSSVYGELHRAICEKDDRYKAVLETAGANVKVLVATVAGYLAHDVSVPIAAVAAVCGAVLLLASKVGLSVFCSFSKPHGACRPRSPDLPPLDPQPGVQTSGSRPRLIVVRGARPNTEYPLQEGQTWIGRGNRGQSGVNLEEQESFGRAKTAPLHALFFVEGGRVVIEDLNSEGGTFVNRQRLWPGNGLELKSGDVIQIAEVHMKLVF